MLTKNTSTWVLPQGVSFLYDKLPDVSSYTLNSDIITITARQTGTHTISNNGQTVNICQERNLGSINMTDSVIYGVAVVANYTSSADAYQWKLVDKNGNSLQTSTTSTININTAPLTGLDTGNIYHLALTVNNNETGWSEYLWHTFRVYAQKADICVDDTNFVYDGSAKQASVNISNPNLSYIVTYNGNTDLPVNAGTYTVVATITSDNFWGQDTAILTIQKAQAPLVITNLTHTFDSTAHYPTVNTYPSGLNYNILYNHSNNIIPVNSGKYAIEVNIDDTNYYGQLTDTLVINKATATFSFGQLTYIYDGTAKTVSVTPHPGNIHTIISYDCGQAPSKVGIYTVYATTDDNNYEGYDSATLVIQKTTAHIALTDTSVIYDGNTHSMNVSITPAFAEYSITYNGLTELPKNAGTYHVIVVTNDSSVTPAYAHAVLTIQKAQADIIITDSVYTFNGSCQAIAYTTIPDNLYVKTLYNNNAFVPSQSGIYSVNMEIVDTNYTGNYSTTLTIQKANANINISNLQHTFSGRPAEAVITTTPGNVNYQIRYNNDTIPPVNHGYYLVDVVITDNNYTGSAQDTLYIAKAPATIQISGLSHTYDGNIHTPVVHVSPAHLNYQIEYTNHLTPVNAGTYPFRISVSDTNYEAFADSALIINKALLALNVTQLNHIYDGTPKNISVSSAHNVNYNITYNGVSTAINAGKYIVNISVTDSNYQGSDSAVMTIEKAHAWFDVSDTALAYNGLAQEPAISVTPSFVLYNITYNTLPTPPVNAGTYLTHIHVTDTANVYGDTAFDFHIMEITAEITIADTIQTYDGQEKNISVNSNNVNYDILYTQHGDTVIPVNAGVYDVEITVNQANYIPTRIYTSLTILPAEAIITFVSDTMVYIYDSTAKQAEVITRPDGLNVLITYNGDTALPVQIGTYIVEATVMDNNYTGSAEGILQIIKNPEDHTPEYTLQNSSVQLYPNPAHNSTTLSIQNYEGDIQMKLINSLGQTLLHQTYRVDQQLVTDIDINHLPKGAYIIILHTGTRTISKQLIKQ
ncbi:MAG: T9SS type A sorting domain-containing protein [Bacteroidales bacterium]|nr:T9SS type A sorting domain-containing protein [Bacteroidales bacterium]